MFKCMKMHGAGNDFLIADDTDGTFKSDAAHIAGLCHRTRGLGADGLILLTQSKLADFRMFFFNCDGSRASMCGNGLRCAALFARKKMNAPFRMTFETDTGLLQAEVLNSTNVQIEIGVNRPFEEAELDGRKMWFGKTGVPHLVIPVRTDLSLFPVMEEGKFYRNHERFSPEGTNVDFMQVTGPNSIFVRTFERGVEAETDACGTGAAAAALVAVKHLGVEAPVMVCTRGDDIMVVDPRENPLRLTGPAVFIAECEIFEN